MRTLRVLNLMLFITCTVISMASKNYMAVLGWLCASIVQLSLLTETQNES